MMEYLFKSRAAIFWVGFVLLFFSISFHAFKKINLSIIFLVLAGFLFFLYSSVTIPVINVWDERFHALVAKNLMMHPLMPTLYEDELLKLPYSWAQSHIWVHKQPLFLWQSALSYKLFGINEFAFRFPGVLLSTGLLIVVYRVGKLLGNNDVGYCTAFLVGTSLYVEQLVSGFWPVDQNDLVFMIYISFSIWAMIEYLFSGKMYWVILAGIFSGFAMLTKEAVGLLVYLIWFLYAFQKPKLGIKQYKPIIISLLITLVLFIPWQIFIFYKYPFEAKTEYQFNIHHFSEVIDGQGGPFLYHFKYIGLIFGWLVPYLIIPAFIIFYIKATDKKIALSIIAAVVFTYIFFSFAKTKMQSFTIVLELPMCLLIAFLINFIMEWVNSKIRVSQRLKAIIIIMFFLCLACFRFDFTSLKTNNGFWGHDVDCCNQLIKNKKIFKALKLPGNAVLCNIPGRHFVEAMYYTNLPAYGFIPNESQYNELKAKGKRVCLFISADRTLPAYMANDKNIILLRDTLEICE